MSLSGGWLNEAAGIGTSPNPSMTGFDVMGAALIFMMLCWQIPKLFAAVLGGSPALSGGDLVATATGVVAGAAAVGSFATGAGAAIAGGAATVANAAGSSGAGGASSAITSVNGAMGSAGRTGGGTVPPPGPPSGTSPNGHPRQPSPPTNGPGGSSRPRSAVLSSVGGESLAGSGFEEEHPASGFTTFSVPIAPPARSATNSGNDFPGGPRPSDSGPSILPESRPPGSERASPGAGQTQRVLSGLTGGLRRARSRFGGLPSDAASHATPPRMPIEHDE
jgi:type IV secretion system protein TrbL